MDYAQIDRSVVEHCAFHFASELEEDTNLLPSQEKMALSDFVDWVEMIGQSEGANVCWKAGMKYDYALRGEIGALILGSRTLGSALTNLVRFFPLIQDQSSLRLERNGRWASLSYKILDPNIWPRHYDAMYSIAVYAALVKMVAPEAWPDVELMFEADARLYNRDLSRIVGVNCSFNCDTNMICFPSRLLDHPMNLAPQVSTELMKILNETLVEKNRNTPFYVKVKHMLFDRLGTSDFRQENIARALGVSGRTLNRRLVAEGYAFQKLLDQTRMELAHLEFRRHQNQSIAQLALKLGYAEHSTFSRAFSRWYGVSPQKFRKKVREEMKNTEKDKSFGLILA